MACEARYCRPNIGLLNLYWQNHYQMPVHEKLESSNLRKRAELTRKIDPSSNKIESMTSAYLQLNFIVSVLRFLVFDVSSRIFNFDFQILQVNETNMSENEKG